MKISICSQIKNRIDQFKQTFEHNFATINQYTNIEWNIVDINSNDGLDSFLSNYINNDKIQYYKSLTDIKYSIPIAKNFAVRLSSGDYVFNLDVDNFLGSIIDKIQALNYSGICCLVYRKGLFGRIGCNKEIFKQLGGYDETFLPAGYHETDLMNRSKFINYNYVHVDSDLPSIENDKNDTIKYIESRLSWDQMNNKNLKQSKKNIEKNILNPNQSHSIGSFVHNFDKIVHLTSNF